MIDERYFTFFHILSLTHIFLYSYILWKFKNLRMPLFKVKLPSSEY